MSERTEELQGKIEDENDPDDIMMNIMEVFSDTEIVPDAVTIIPLYIMLKLLVYLMSSH